MRIIALLLAIAALAVAGCGTTAPSTAGPTVVQPRQPLLTPIPGVTTTERVLAFTTCLSGLRQAAVATAAIEDAADDSRPEAGTVGKLAVADQTIQEARAKGVTTGVLTSCSQTLGYAARAREIREAGKKPAG